MISTNIAAALYCEIQILKPAKETIWQQVFNARQQYLQAVCFDVCPECVQDSGASGLLQAQHCGQGC